jgi:hypothetical protein
VTETEPENPDVRTARVVYREASPAPAGQDATDLRAELQRNREGVQEWMQQAHTSRTLGDVDEVLRIVRDWVVESNDIGGVDAGDLAFRLEQAGYPLPD